MLGNTVACPNCNEEIIAASVFCKYCGQEVPNPKEPEEMKSLSKRSREISMNDVFNNQPDREISMNDVFGVKVGPTEEEIRERRKIQIERGEFPDGGFEFLKGLNIYKNIKWAFYILLILLGLIFNLLK